METTLKDLSSNVEAATVDEVKKGISMNIESLNNATIVMNEKLSEIKTFMCKQLIDIDDKKHQFFRWNKFKTIAFWTTQAVTFIALGLMIFYLFFKG